MHKLTLQVKILCQIIIALILALCLIPIHSNTVTAQSLHDYFTVNYSIDISDTDIQEGEVSYATVEATATCHTRLPVKPSEAKFTSRVIAEHQISGAEVVLNSGYTVTISPFPSQEGETIQDTQVVSLEFPAGSQSGSYNLVAELIEAKVKVSIMWFDVKSYLPPYMEIGSVDYNIDRGSASENTTGGSSGGIVPPPTLPTPPTLPALTPGTYDVSNIIRSDGTFIESFQAKSTDDGCRLSVSKGTRGLTPIGSPLSKITIIKKLKPPAPPEYSSLIGPSYDLGPGGASFDPGILLTIAYEEELIPAGVSEEKMGIATRDDESGSWVMLTDSTVNPGLNTISTTVDHFTLFSILAHAHPAIFTVSGLSITPGQVNTGEDINISVIVTNSGDLAGNYRVVLVIDNVIISEREVSVESGDSEEVTFITGRGRAGTYAVGVNGLSGTFTVIESSSVPSPSPSPSPAPATFDIESLTISPDKVEAGEEVSISFIIKNSGELAGSYEVALKVDGVVVDRKGVTLAGGGHDRVTFINIEDIPGTHRVNVDGLAGTFTVGGEEVPGEVIPPKPANWWLVGGILTGFLITVAIIILVVRRETA
ncbi:hypothetical protein ACFLXX_01055 [Chloroflexota bacterium]